MNDLARILGLAGLATEKSVAAPADRELKEQDGCPCGGGGHCKCSGDCPDCNCHGNNEWDESVVNKAKDPVGEASKPDFLDVDGDGDREESWKDAEEDKEELDEATAKIACLKCDEVSTAKAWEKNHGFCPKCKTSSQGVAESIEEDDELTESPTMDTTQLVIMMRNAGLSEEVISQKLDEWANTPEGVGEVEPTVHGDAYDFAQSVNLSLKRYLDAQDMKVQVTEHKVEDMKALYEAHKAKK